MPPVTREAIIDAAREVFTREPYESASLREIARRVGCSAPNLLNHFRDKEAIFLAICDEDFRALREEFGRVAKVRDPVERLERIGLGYVEFAMKNPHHYRFMFMTPHVVADPDAPTLDRRNPDQDAYAFLRATVAEAIAAGRLRDDCDDPDMVAQVLWSGVHGLVSLHLNKGGDPCLAFRDVHETARLLVVTMIRGLLKKGR